jgi:predicted aldo/keto reductase-like oxidoreductase
MRRGDRMKGSRRDFLRSGLVLAAAAAIPSCSNDQKKQIERPPKYPLVKRTLGRTGIEIPIISMGGSSWDESVYFAAMESGIIFIDTDHMYRNGKHERFLGRVIKRRPRESMIVSTRINIDKDRRTGMYPKGTRGEEFLKPFEKCIANLDVDYLDILSLHSVMSVQEAVFPPALETFQKLKSEGRTRFLGVSVHGYEPDVIRAITDCGVYDIIFISYNFKQRHREEIRNAIAYAADAGLGIIAMKTQAGAFLDRERTKPVNHRAAIKWVLGDTNVHTVIPGFSSIEQMKMFLSVMNDLELTPEEQADLALAHSLEGLYCQQCGSCVGQCRYGVEIPAYMRAYMYAYGYRNPGQARDTIKEISPAIPSCGRCGDCTVSCTMGFDVRDRVLDIVRLRDVPEDFLSA